MSESVEVPFGDKPDETATLLLAAAEDLGLDSQVVRTTGRQAFVVPTEVNEKAFGKSTRKRSSKSTENPEE